MRRLAHSKAVDAAGYDVVTRTLCLRFRHGGLYEYFDVPAEVFAGLTSSAHPWTEWGQQIKQTYAVRRLQ